MHLDRSSTSDRDAAVLFDTGLTESSVIGINAPKRYRFRRTATCAPYTQLTGKPPGFGFAIGSGGGSGGSSSVYTKYLIEQGLGTPLWESTIGLYIGSMSYPTYRDGPVFKAQTPGVSEFDLCTNSKEAENRYFNNGTTHLKITCIDHVQICDSMANQCWYMPNYNEPRNLLRSRNLNGVSSNNDSALVLLEACLADSTLMSVLTAVGDRRYGTYAMALEAESHCSHLSCDDLPDDQWKIEVRRWFEASLARIQLNVLDIVRPTSDPENNETVEEQWLRIPAEYRNICHMGKFRSTGWRNISVWGFFGLLGLAAVLTLASCETEKGELWIVLAAEFMGWCSMNVLRRSASLTKFFVTHIYRALRDIYKDLRGA
ncbi:uncharacterized protein KY384_004786 [Bacidia gigantensis]|uniref:uncharacterized protein n=1 Tax=Bacidia gigantensis TaxID=2732470 RepID=UPI001D055A3F|nr:uncharacterized protein KY384_004786 [Bacidia gigantensis]KAG8530284.1 hypothetical protein KY384_004786 [Bacidia gigantensis]